MAYELIHPRPFTVGSSFVLKQFTFVTLDASATLSTPTAGAYAIGVIQDKPASGAAQVCSPGDFSKVLCGGSFNAGDDVTTDGNGKAVEATSGDQILGKAMEAGALNKVVTILYQPQGAM